MAEEQKGTLVSADSALKTSQDALTKQARATERKAKGKGETRSDRPRREREVREPQEGDIQGKLIGINRITKVVKGGRTLRFNAIVVVGDLQGRVGIGSGKAREVSEAIRKAEQDGMKNMRTVPIVGTTIPHEVIGKFGTSKVIMMPSKEGTGLVAGVSVRAVLSLAGYRDVTAKCHGSTNPRNVVKATMDALEQLRTREEVMYLRGKSK